ncbi:MAG: tyrosine-type recombinase/integrase, partial [Alphaproteobacteria bacterium]
AGSRDIPLAPMVINALKEWKLECPKGDLNLVFPNTVGNVEFHSNIWNRGFQPLQIECGITEDSGRKDKEGKPILKGKYGLHALRHAAASLFIEQGWTPKRIQTVLGHASIQMTFDLYGHLFKDADDDREEMKQVQARLLP